MIKAVFFDVDGTLLSHTLKDVPKSTRTALMKLRQKNIKCVVATGRHLSELEILPVKDIDFDGYITLNGQLCLDENQRILSGKPITGSDKETIIRLFKEKKIPVLIVEKDALYINFVNQHVEKAQIAISTDIPRIGTYTGNEIYQAVAYLERGKEAYLAEQLPNCKITRWNEYAVDIISSCGGKAEGIIEYLNKNGIAQCETMAFGDGENDIDMLRFAQIGIAMGNADSAVKSAADYVTENVDDDGIEQALKFWKIID